MSRSLRRRFIDHISICTLTGCWNWTGTKSDKNYGKFNILGKPKFAHRVSMQLFRPDENIDGLFVCHHCDNPSCVNPNHLFPGTPQDNVLDMVSKRRHGAWTQPEAFKRCGQRGPEHKDAKLTAQQVREIRESTESSRVLGRRLGVDHSQIVRIRQGKTHKSVS